MSSQAKQASNVANESSGPNIVILSGGTASNSLVNTFSSLSPHISYVLPISDNGGSTSELMRVIGGPAIGDLRSRITRLIPDKSANLRDLLSHRLSDYREDAKQEWSEIVDGTHPLWFHVESQCRELIRPFFTHVHVELLKRSRPNREFRFESASVGNLFLTGARLFCGSLDSAIELLLRVTLVPSSISVLPALNTNFSHHISAQLENGVVITGQSQISHPSEVFYSAEPSALTAPLPTDLTQPALYVQPPAINPSRPSTPLQSSRYKTDHSTTDAETSDEEDAHLPFSHPDLKTSQLHFSKEVTTPLVSPIRKIFYINPYGQEIHPRASSRVVRSLEKADAVIYSIGSLFTSTVPVVILQGFASAIQTGKKKKILLLNGSLDRETQGLDALGFVRALVSACIYSEQEYKHPLYQNANNNSSMSSLVSSFQQPLLTQPHLSPTSHYTQPHLTPHHPQSGLSSSASLAFQPGRKSTPISSFSSSQGFGASKDSPAPPDAYDSDRVTQASWSKYLSHIIYLSGSDLEPSTKAIEELAARGIKCMGVQGSPEKLNQYSPETLQDTLAAIINS